MPSVVLRNLFRKRKDVASVVAALACAFGTGIAIEDPDGELLFDDRDGGSDVP
jgi:hypothetical protein